MQKGGTHVCNLTSVAHDIGAEHMGNK